MKTSTPYLLFLCIGLAISSCRCKDDDKPCTDPSNPDCENYDPCYGKKAPSADFSIEGNAWHMNIYNGQTNFSIEDSIFGRNANGISFIAKEQNAKYIWTLGAEKIENQRFTRTFSNTPYGTFSVKLTIEKDVDNTCFSEYTGTTTLAKKFETRPYYEFPIMGKYKVLFGGSTDSSIVEIRPYKTSTVWLRWEVLDSMSSDHFAFIGFRNGTDTFDYYRNIDLSYGGSLVLTGNNIIFSDNNGVISLGFLKLTDNALIEAEYTASFYALNPEKKYKFKGRKLE